MYWIAKPHTAWHKSFAWVPVKINKAGLTVWGQFYEWRFTGRNTGYTDDVEYRQPDGSTEIVTAISWDAS